MVQQMKGDDKTFAQLAESALFKVLHEGTKSQRIDVVFDVYKETSIKDVERAHRSTERGIQFKNIAPGHNIQQWRKLLCSSSNKASLIKFLVDGRDPNTEKNSITRRCMSPVMKSATNSTKNKWKR